MTTLLVDTLPSSLIAFGKALRKIVWSRLVDRPCA